MGHERGCVDFGKACLCQGVGGRKYGWRELPVEWAMLGLLQQDVRCALPAAVTVVAMAAVLVAVACELVAPAVVAGVVGALSGAALAASAVEG